MAALTERAPIEIVHESKPAPKTGMVALEQERHAGRVHLRDLHQQLNMLNTLHASDLLTGDEYQVKRGEIIQKMRAAGYIQHGLRRELGKLKREKETRKSPFDPTKPYESTVVFEKSMRSNKSTVTNQENSNTPEIKEQLAYLKQKRKRGEISRKQHRLLTKQLKRD